MSERLPRMPSSISLRSPRRWVRWVAYAAVAAVAGTLLAWWLTIWPELQPVEPPAAPAFSSSAIQRGAQLAAVGDCMVCHTAERGKPLAGARALATPFGTLYSTNITPDAQTGIGRWSLPAFKRAMRDGVSRDGHHLYPALPYEHFTKVSDQDLSDIYAYLMTRDAVMQPAPANRLIPPLGFRPVLAGWKLLFFEKGPFVPQPTQTAQWNRGAYLAEGLGHCGGCHTPRNLLGAETFSRSLAGGIAEGWPAPALDSTNPSASQWDANALYRYLRTGADERHGMAGGPMAPVVHSLADASADDVRALAVYIDTAMHPAGRTDQHAGLEVIRRQLDVSQHAQGTRLFEGACAGCHAPQSPMAHFNRAPMTSLSALRSDDPRNALMAVMQGLHSPTTEARPYMPAFSETLSDAQIAAVLNYSRARFTDRPAWIDLEESAAKARKEIASP